MSEIEIDLSGIVDDVRKEFGDERIFTMDDEDAISKLEVQDWLKVPEPFSKILGGTEGLPCGLITIFQGKSDSGKTTMAIEEMIETQKDGGIAVICLSEPKFSLDRAKKMGLSRNGLIIIRVKTIEEGEEKLSVIIKKIRAKYPDKKVTIIWDSLGYSKCKMELESKKQNNMWKASALKSMLGTMQIWLDEDKTVFIGINHTYMTMQGRNKGGGGEGVKLAAAMIFDFASIGKIMGEDTYYMATNDFEHTDKDGDVLSFSKGEIVPKELVLGDKASGIKQMKLEFRKDNLEKHSDKRGLGIKTIVKNVKNHVGIPFLQTELKIDQYGVVSGRKVNERR